MAPKFFVAGATGTQGGALVRQLLQSTPTPTIHAVARDPSSPKAKALEALGVHLHAGSYDDEPALRAAITPGTTAIFLNFMPDFTDHTANLRQAQLIIGIAREVGVTHAVFSSGLGVDDIPYVCEGNEDGTVATFLRAKAELEDAVRNAGFDTWTVLRPANFMANYKDPFVRFQAPGLAESGRAVGAIDVEAPLPLIATRTIGGFSAAALLEPARFGGKTISYADEFVPLKEVIQKLRAFTGKDLQYIRMSEEDIQAQKAVNPFVGGALAVTKIAKYVDLDEVKSWGVPLQTFDEFLESEKEAVLETYAQVASI